MGSHPDSKFKSGPFGVGARVSVMSASRLPPLLQVLFDYMLRLKNEDRGFRYLGCIVSDVLAGRSHITIQQNTHSNQYVTIILCDLIHLVLPLQKILNPVYNRTGLIQETR